MRIPESSTLTQAKGRRTGNDWLLKNKIHHFEPQQIWKSNDLTASESKIADCTFKDTWEYNNKNLILSYFSYPYHDL